MSSGLLGKTSKRDTDLITRIAENQIRQINGEMPGEIVTFDPEKQTAEIKVLFRPKFDSVLVQLPNLLDVPVRFDRCSCGGLTYPIKPGDRVNLRPQMRSTSSYHTTGEHKAEDSRMFSLSDMEAYIDGGESLVDPIENFDSENMNLRFNESGEFGLKGSPDGRMKIDLNEGDLVDLLAELCEILAANQTQVSSGSSAGIHVHTEAAALQGLAARIRAMVLS